MVKKYIEHQNEVIESAKLSLNEIIESHNEETLKQEF